MWYHSISKRFFFSENEIRNFFPNSSLPAQLTNEHLSELLIFPFQETLPPSHDGSLFEVALDEPTLTDGVYIQKWKLVRRATLPHDSSENHTLSNQEKAAAFEVILNAELQKRLDDFARAKKYDNIQSACSYGNSTNLTFAEDARQSIKLRDQICAAAIEILNKIELGELDPKNIEEIEILIPKLEW